MKDWIREEAEELEIARWQILQKRYEQGVLINILWPKDIYVAEMRKIRDEEFR